MSNFELESFDLEEGNPEFIGAAHIFSNYKFTNLPPRKGNRIDLKALEDSLPKLGFHTKVHRNVKSDNCVKKLKKIAVEDGRNFSCLLVIFLTHGNLDKIRMSDGLTVAVESIMECFNGTYQGAKADLEGKPILFLFQACQGDRIVKEIENSTSDEEEVDAGTDCNPASPSGQSNTNDSEHHENDCDDAILEEVEDASCLMPGGSNIFAGFASSPGYVSYRSPSMGSRFIQTFTAIINDEVNNGNIKVKVDFVLLMTKVAAEVAKMKGKNWPYDLAKKARISTPTGFPLNEERAKIKKQIPWFSSTLTKRLEFTKHPNRNASYGSSNTVTESVGGQHGNGREEATPGIVKAVEQDVETLSDNE